MSGGGAPRSTSATDDADSWRGRADSWRGRAVEWVLLGGSRELLALAVAGCFLAFFTSLFALGVVPLEDVQALFYAYSGLIAGNLTLVTVVVSINQLLLSRELQTPGELREQIDSVIEYRRDVEAAADEIAPVEPEGFLRLLVEATREEAQRLGGFTYDGLVRRGGEEIQREVTELTERMDHTDRLLQESEEDTIHVLILLLETNYAREINRLRRIRDRHEEELSEAVHDAIDDLVDRLQEMDVARQYFKSIYLQQELSRLSRVLLYVGLPAVAVAIGGLLYLTVPSGAPGVLPYPAVVVTGTLTIGCVPLAVLSSYILRTATVTNLTAATLPFTTPEQER